MTTTILELFFVFTLASKWVRMVGFLVASHETKGALKSTSQEPLHLSSTHTKTWPCHCAIQHMSMVAWRYPMPSFLLTRKCKALVSTSEGYPPCADLDYPSMDAATEAQENHLSCQGSTAANPAPVYGWFILVASQLVQERPVH